MHIMSSTFGHKFTSGKKVQFNRVSNCVSKLAYGSHVLVNNKIWTQTEDIAYPMAVINCLLRTQPRQEAGTGGGLQELTAGFIRRDAQTKSSETSLS